MFILFTGLILGACSTTNNHRDILFIRTSRLIDGINDSVYKDLDVIVISGRIAGVGRDLAVPKNARLIDFRKYTVLPYPLRAFPVPSRAGDAMPAIKHATYLAAKELGIENRTGSIGPGMAADFIGVTGDPMTDSNALRKVQVEMKNGLLQSK